MRNILKESDTRISGNPISFIDIDETTMHTFAKVNVMKDGNVVKSLDNKEFNTHELGDGETYNFDNFRDAKYFNQTSQPIEKTIGRIKNIIQSIKDNKKKEKVIFLTARADFDDKEVFLDTFRKFGIDVDIPNVHVERSGNLTNIKSVADRKRYVILKYLKSGLYTAAKMYDDDRKNLETFEELGQEVNNGKYGILDKVQENFPRVSKINFYPLLVTNSGKINAYESVEDKGIEIIEEDVNAYHGSHKNFDEFDTKFIDSGEGCQAHGWGLYFALNPDTAKGYHNRISGYHDSSKKNSTDISLSYNGKTYSPNTVQGKIIKRLYNKGKNDTLNFLNNLSKESQFTKNPEKYKAEIKRLYNLVNKINPDDIKKSFAIKRGQLYTVKIPDLETYIEEKKKMYEQSDYVKNICKNILSDLNHPFKAKALSGSEFYNKLQYYSLNNGDHFTSGKNSLKDVSEFLHNNGISGIKYYGGQDGNCVVIFNKNDVKIVKKDVEYGNDSEGIQMSDITKFIDDPKKLKGKRVPEEVIDWFIENKIDIIPVNVYLEKMTPEQKVKYVAYDDKNTMIHNIDEVMKIIEENNINTPEVSLVKLKKLGLEYALGHDVLDEILKIVKSIPLEERKKYILKCGDSCIQRISQAPKNKKNIEIVNAFFNGLTIDDVKKNDSSILHKIYANESGYNDYIDVVKYLIIDSLYHYPENTHFTIQTPIDELLYEYLDANRHADSKRSMSIYKNEDNMDDKSIFIIKKLIEYNKNGVYELDVRAGYSSVSDEEIYETFYTPDIIKSFNKCDSINQIPAPICRAIRNNPIVLKDLNDNLFKEICEKWFRIDLIENINLFNKNLMDTLGPNKVHSLINEVMKYIEKSSTNRGNYRLINFIKVLIQNDFMNYKDFIIKIAMLMPALLHYYKEVPTNVQKVLCSKNPYMIKYFKNPDPKLVEELKNKYPNIVDYINDGDYDDIE